MNKTFKLVLICFLGSTLFTFAQNKISPEYKEAVLEMLELTGSKEAYDVMIKNSFDVYKSRTSNFPAEAWDDFEKEFVGESKDELFGLLIPIYNKHLSLEDVKEINAFYKTPVGKKLSSNMPSIMDESMKVGGEWGRKIGERFVQKIKEKGY